MYIVITQPYFFEGEADRITLMFQSGLKRLHLRKPESSIDACRELLQAIPACYHSRIVLHDHFELLHEFALGGVHLNSRNPQAPFLLSPESPSVSRSCHSLAEVAEWKERCTYVSLSPIFDSISKEGYRAAFSADELRRAAADGIIDERVMALGGISAENIHEAMALGFAGVMVLGDAWRTSQLPIVLSIAGSDPSAGAGIQQDLKTITNHSCYGTTVITSLTSQNTCGVQSTMPVPAEVVESQLRAVLSDMRVDAVKIGIIPNYQVAEVIVRLLHEEKQRRILPIVYDPVMISTSGHPLMTDDCIDFVQRELFPLCTIITPNLPEAERLHLPQAIGSSCEHTNVLIKGGHAAGDEMTDTLHLVCEQRTELFASPRIQTSNLHGTGCTLSSAIASNMAKGMSLVPAVAAAKTYVTRAIQGGQSLHLGHGNGPLWNR